MGKESRHGEANGMASKYHVELADKSPSKVAAE